LKGGGVSSFDFRNVVGVARVLRVIIRF
jgi:hypothetical protein